MSSSRAEASGMVRTDFKNRSTWSIFQARYQATSRFFLSFVSISRGWSCTWSRWSKLRRRDAAIAVEARARRIS